MAKRTRPCWFPTLYAFVTFTSVRTDHTLLCRGKEKKETGSNRVYAEERETHLCLCQVALSRSRPSTCQCMPGQKGEDSGGEELIELTRLAYMNMLLLPKKNAEQLTSVPCAKASRDTFLALFGSHVLFEAPFADRVCDSDVSFEHAKQYMGQPDLSSSI